MVKNLNIKISDEADTNLEFYKLNNNFKRKAEALEDILINLTKNKNGE